VTAQDHGSALEVLRNVDLYGRASGAKINIEKPEIMCFGDRREKVYRVERKKGLF